MDPNYPKAKIRISGNLEVSYENTYVESNPSC